MSFANYTPTPTELTDLVEADGNEKLKAATTNVSLEQLADAIAWLGQRAVIQVLEQNTFDVGGSQGTTNTGFTDIATGNLDTTFNVTATAGNALDIEVHGAIQLFGPTSTRAYLQLAIVDPLLNTITNGGWIASSEVVDAHVPFSIRVRYLVTDTGTHTLKIRGKVDIAGGTAAVQEYLAFHVLEIRRP